MKNSPDISSRIPASPSNALFLHAWTRIWDGDPGRGVRFWETFFWSVLAIFSGFTIFGWVDPLIVRATAWITYAALILATPLAIGTWVYRVHTSVGSADESLRALPLKPREILLPRMRAVLFTWARIFLPIVLIFIVTGLIPTIRGVTDPIRISSALSYSILMRIESFALDFDVPGSRLAMLLLNLAAPCFLIGCVTAPIAWGFWLATRFRFSSAGYFVGFMFYYLFLCGIYWSVKVAYYCLLYSTREKIWPYLDDNTYIMMGSSFSIVTWLCYRTSCDLLGRRS